MTPQNETPNNIFRHIFSHTFRHILRHPYPNLFFAFLSSGILVRKINKLKKISGAKKALQVDPKSEKKMHFGLCGTSYVTPRHTYAHLLTPTHTHTHLHTPTHTYTHLHTPTHTSAHPHTPTHAEPCKDLVRNTHSKQHTTT